MSKDQNSAALLEADSHAREAALALDSFIVEAPAGAGKTELLTQRYLRLLATVDEPEEIIAITFTNKAAGEMRERIQSALDRARRGECPPEPHKQITYRLAQAALARAQASGWQIEQQAGRLRLTTIDALCASLARQMPLLSRFGAQPAVADNARRHYEEAARRVLASMEEAVEVSCADPLSLVLAHLDNDTARFERLLADMLSRREQWRTLWQAGLDQPESLITDALRVMVAMALGQVSALLDARWQGEVMPLARYASDQLRVAQGESASDFPLLDWSSPLQADACELPSWRALADMALTKEGTARKSLTVKNGFPTTDKAKKQAMLEVLAQLSEAQIAALGAVRQLPDPSSVDAALVRALVAVLKDAAAQLWLVFREAGEVDFPELAMRAMAALSESANTEAAPTELALRLDYRIRHLLVDEFQDTSPAQIELLTALTAGWQRGDGRTLFLVGDPMQSIYRFRKADVGLFLQVAAHGLGDVALNSLRLSRNNRADPALVEWINQSFGEIFPARDEPLSGEIRYRPFVATKAPAPDAGVSIHPIVVGDEVSADDIAAQEAARMVDIIDAEWQADPTRRIAVLVRARGHLQALVGALRAHPAAWRFSAVDVEPLLGRQGVQDLIALTCALHHRADRLNWLAVLRAPWCGLTLSDLHALCAHDHEATLFALMSDPARVARLSADGVPRVIHVREVLGEALLGQGRMPLRRWVEDTWRKLGGEVGLSEAELADALSYFARLAVLDQAGRFDPDTLEADMSALYAQADAQADGRLQLMTIHKSKGLEFDTVILPGLQRVLPDNDTPLLLWDTFAIDDGGRVLERVVVAPMNRRRAISSDMPSAYDYLRALERERSSNEELRVLYVAATRTVRHLHLLGTVVRKDDGELRNARSSSALARLWPALAGDFVASMVVQTRDAAQEGETPELSLASSLSLGDFAGQLHRLRAPALRPEWQAPALRSAHLPTLDDIDAFAAAMGTLVHACLEQMVRFDELWSVPDLPARAPSFAAWLAAQGWSANEARVGAQRAVDLLTVTLGSPDGRWVLSAQEDGAAELVLSSVDFAKVSAGDTAIVRVIDRCFIADGVRWIVDYKIADLGQNASEGHLKKHAEYYREQLGAYARLFAGEGLPIRCAVFYVAHGKLIEFETNHL
jgi:ATP-dependent helicase/nuclease subunit A